MACTKTRAHCPLATVTVWPCPPFMFDCAWRAAGRGRRAAGGRPVRPPADSFFPHTLLPCFNAPANSSACLLPPGQPSVTGSDEAGVACRARSRPRRHRCGELANALVAMCRAALFLAPAHPDFGVQQCKGLRAAHRRGCSLPGQRVAWSHEVPDPRAALASGAGRRRQRSPAEASAG